MIDWSATAAWIALIVAIISPIFTTWINNKSQRQSEQTKLIWSQKVSIYSEFVDAYGKLHENGSLDGLWKFSSSAYKAALMADEATAKKIFQLVCTLQQSIVSNNQTDSLFAECLECLDKELKKM